MGNEKVVVLQVKLTRKRCLFFALTLILLCFHPHMAGSETLTLTTYYPAPYGGYVSLLTTQLTMLARDGGSVGIGTPGPNAKLDVKGLGNTAATFSLGVRNSNDIYSLSVRNDGNVGIGTTNPGAMLDVAGDLMVRGRLIPVSLPADPPGVQGAVYINTALQRLRMFSGGIWRNVGDSPTSYVQMYQCPGIVSLGGGAWGFYGCTGQITNQPTCIEIEYPNSQVFSCTPIGKMGLYP